MVPEATTDHVPARQSRQSEVTVSLSDRHADALRSQRDRDAMHMQHTSAPSRTLMWTPEKLIANKQVLAGGPSAVRMIRFENITTRVQHSYFLSSSISLGPRLVLQVIQSVWLCSMVHMSSSRSPRVRIPITTLHAFISRQSRRLRSLHTGLNPRRSLVRVSVGRTREEPRQTFFNCGRLGDCRPLSVSPTLTNYGGQTYALRFALN
jgi:hypothetical protein